ncbi:MAG: hypothetical protein WCO02_12700 [Bacteroidota bacterium]
MIFINLAASRKFMYLLLFAFLFIQVSCKKASDSSVQTGNNRLVSISYYLSDSNMFKKQNYYYTADKMDSMVFAGAVSSVTKNTYSDGLIALSSQYNKNGDPNTLSLITVSADKYTNGLPVELTQKLYDYSGNLASEFKFIYTYDFSVPVNPVSPKLETMLQLQLNNGKYDTVNKYSFSYSSGLKSELNVICFNDQGYPPERSKYQYSYINGRLALEVFYFYYNNTWQQSIKDTFEYSGNLLSRKLEYFPNGDSTWRQGHTWIYKWNGDGNISEVFTWRLGAVTDRYVCQYTAGSDLNQSFKKVINPKWFLEDPDLPYKKK